MFSSFKIEQHPFKHQVSNTLPFFNSLLRLIRFVVVFSCFVFFQHASVAVLWRWKLSISGGTLQASHAQPHTQPYLHTRL